jgi:predicted RNA binding protein YcfA (HicA-like mRNA interferase family)
MSKRKKLLLRIKQNPKDVIFNDLRKLLEMYGFTLKRTRGSHHSFKGLVSGQSVLFVVPYKQPLKEIYVKKALILIEQIDNENPEGDE